MKFLPPPTKKIYLSIRGTKISLTKRIKYGNGRKKKKPERWFLRFARIFSSYWGYFVQFPLDFLEMFYSFCPTLYRHNNIMLCARVGTCVYYIIYVVCVYKYTWCSDVISVGKSAAEKERSESDRAACFAWHTIVRDQWVGERSVHCARVRTARATRTLPINNVALPQPPPPPTGHTYLYASGSGNFFFSFFLFFFFF